MFYNYKKEEEKLINGRLKIISLIVPYLKLKNRRNKNFSTLYLIKIKGQKPLFKIGVSKYNVVSRYDKKEQKKFQYYWEWNFKDNVTSYNIEQYILELFKNYRYKGQRKILKNGQTELIPYDIEKLVLNLVEYSGGVEI